MKEIKFKLNDKQLTYTGNMTNRLLDVLRNEYDIKSVKCSCNDGKCGICSIIINGLLSNSCIIAIGSIHNSEIYTLEYYENTTIYKELIKVFDSFNIECKFSINGLLMSSISLLLNNPKPSKEEIRISISGNIIRDSSYNSIIDAIYEVSRNEAL